ncbi:MAG: hypothetical protein JSW06_09025 [Thermoplasmatales archaeon]|nr:MAG: hypothetical protein JSW06_09025 [Thermoplasmatales archaeon]
MGNILTRKDKTSIFCPQILPSRHGFSKKTRFAKVIIAFSLIMLGTWIMILAN